MSKYIIEIAKEYEEYFKGILICGIADGKFAVDVIAREDLEELNSDYINEHYGSLQDDAYQRGLEDAWEAAGKIGHASQMLLKEMGFEFNSNEWFYNPSWYVVMNYTASEAIAKLKAYEEKQNDKIEVGDEVLWFMKGDDEGCDDIMDVCAPSVVTMVPNKECDDYTIIESSGAMTVISKEQIYKKTGRHFDIASILEDMRND